MTETGFNLIDKSWIPCHGKLLSVSDALLDGHNLPGWPCADPGTAEMVIRLLVPMVYRITGLDNPNLTRSEFVEAQAALLVEGRLCPDAVAAYLEAHRDRFWLADPPDDHPPFAQDPSLAKVSPHPPAKAVIAWASGSNPIFGPHADSRSISPAVAAVSLLVQRGYSQCGISTPHPSTGNPRGYVDNAPLRRTMSAHPVGVTFTHTLIGHLIPPQHGTSMGSPFWESPPQQNPVAPHMTRAGLLEQIAVRQDKTMLLRPGGDGRIIGFTIAEGPGITAELGCEDPYLIVTAEGAPAKSSAGRAIWREAESLLVDKDSGSPHSRAGIIDWAIDPDRGAANYPPSMFAWAVVCHHSDQAKELAWTCSYFPRLLHLFDKRTAKRCSDYLSLARKAEKAMCEQIDEARESAGLTKPTNPKYKSYVYAAACTLFWAKTEAGFWATAETQHSDIEATYAELLSHALSGYDKATASMLGDRRTHMAVVERRRWLERWKPHKGRQASENEETT